VVGAEGSGTGGVDSDMMSYVAPEYAGVFQFLPRIPPSYVPLHQRCISGCLIVPTTDIKPCSNSVPCTPCTMLSVEVDFFIDIPDCHNVRTKHTGTHVGTHSATTVHCTFDARSQIQNWQIYFGVFFRRHQPMMTVRTTYDRCSSPELAVHAFCTT
jgi:hypothetical protein